MLFPLPHAMLDFLILAILSKQDSYGYELCQIIKTIQQIKEPVLYPILKKLQDQKLIDSYERMISGRRRKYYSITPAGRVRLDEMKADWADYTAGFARILDKEN